MYQTWSVSGRHVSKVAMLMSAMGRNHGGHGRVLICASATQAHEQVARNAPTTAKHRQPAAATADRVGTAKPASPLVPSGLEGLAVDMAPSITGWQPFPEPALWPEPASGVRPAAASSPVVMARVRTQGPTHSSPNCRKSSGQHRIWRGFKVVVPSVGATATVTVAPDRRGSLRFVTW